MFVYIPQSDVYQQVAGFFFGGVLLPIHKASKPIKGAEMFDLLFLSNPLFDWKSKMGRRFFRWLQIFLWRPNDSLMTFLTMTTTYFNELEYRYLEMQ